MTGAWIDVLRLNWRHADARTRSGWPAGTRLIELPNATVRVRERGTGERTILLSPDAPVVLENFVHLMDLLSAHARVVCFEMPGTGFSWPRLGYGFTLDDMVGVTGAVMDALQIERATLALSCGNALGAAAFAARHPERVERLVLAQVASVADMQAWGRRIDFRVAGISLVNTPVLGQLFMAARRDVAALSWLRAALPPRFDVDLLWRDVQRNLAQGGQFCLASGLAGLRGITPAAIGEIRCPVSLNWGMADRTHRRTAKDSFQAHAPHARIRCHESHGHCLDVEAPEFYARQILQA